MNSQLWTLLESSSLLYKVGHFVKIIDRNDGKFESSLMFGAHSKTALLNRCAPIEPST